MFERRLKIFLGLVVALSLVLLARAAQLQLAQHDHWEVEAEKRAASTRPTPALRGTIVDFKGLVMADDAPCIDAAVEYRAIVKDPKWIKDQAAKRLSDPKDAPRVRSQRAQFLAEQAQKISDQIDAMWETLADVSGQSPEDIAEIRNEILRKVEYHHAIASRRPYELALRKYREKAAQQAKANHSWLVRWLLGGTGSPPQEQDFQVTIAEEMQSHVVLRDISNDQYVELSKRLEQCPGLVLRQGTRRQAEAPANTVCAHLLGRVADDGFGRRFGSFGLEKLFEPELRGTPGCVEYLADRAESVEISKSVPGQTVHCSVDVELNAQNQSNFQSLAVKVPTQRADGSYYYKDETRENLHGAWVVIDVPTGEVRSMGSFPTYDLNEFAAQYAQLNNDVINRPLINRATMDQLEPGSSVKVVIGSTALTKGFVAEHEGIECTGFLTLRNLQTGKLETFLTQGRCWMQRQYGKPGCPPIIHHAYGSYPHHGSFGNQDGFLTVTDALMRSCNVVFETIADRMGLDEVQAAMANFGLGRVTGIGIEESKGHIPDPAKISPALRRMTCCMAGIGEEQVLATPLQMANVAATLGRDGVWIRPHLMVGQTLGPDDRRDLGLTPAALAAVRLGMIEVANTPGGTGLLEIDDLLVAGKTGSAQTSPLRIPLRDAAGQPVLVDGQPQFQVLKPGAFPWYQGTGNDGQSMAHAWYIGYAPADHPQIAFAVLVEYGGSGGYTAGPIARKLLEACQEDGYLPRTPGVTAPYRQPQ